MSVPYAFCSISSSSSTMWYVFVCAAAAAVTARLPRLTHNAPQQQARLPLQPCAAARRVT